MKYPGKHRGRRNVVGWRKHKDGQRRKKSPRNLYAEGGAVQTVISRFELSCRLAGLSAISSNRYRSTRTWFQMGLGFSLGMIMHSACWRSSESFGRDDLLVLAQLLGATYTFILQKQAEN
jgi:hypothetical protein